MAKSAIARADTESLVAQVVPSLSLSERLGPYEIQSAMGRGGMGLVYRAKVVESCSLPVGREVAIKVLRASHQDPIDRRRFEREAAYLQALHHPGIVRVYDVGDKDGRPYLVMELVNGRSLDDLILEGNHAPLPEDLSADVIIQALEALHVAHLAGITHRDVKPGNIMINDDGQVKVLDFGMAQRLGAESRLTASGSVLGTPAYMSPEQARGLRDDIGTTSDVYGMGAVLYELITGQQPYKAENSVALLRAILEDPLVPPSEIKPDISRDLETIILRAMAKDIRDRYRNAEAMAADLRRLRRGHRIRSTRPNPLLPVLRKLVYYRRLLSTLGLILVVLGLISAVAIKNTLEIIEEQERLKEEKELREQQTASAWIEAWRNDGPLTYDSPVTSRRQGEFDVFIPVDEERRAILVDGDLSLEFKTKALTDRARFEFWFAGTSVDKGYRIIFERLEEPAGSWSLELLRLQPGEEKRARMVEMMTSEIDSGVFDLDDMALIGVSREENIITITANGEALMAFDDLVPLEGPKHAHLAMAIRRDTAEIDDILLLRKRRPELISRFAVADYARLDGRFEAAEAMYREFLIDFPDSPRARDAHYRLGLCQMARENYDQALTTFQAVSDEAYETLEAITEEDPDFESRLRRYYINGTFQAWICALRLGRYEEADTYYAAISNRFSGDTIKKSANRNLIGRVPEKYIERAREIAEDLPQRSLKLLSTAADFASFLKRNDLVVLATIDAGYHLVGMGRLPEAMDRFSLIADDKNFPREDRMQALLGIAHIHHLMGNVAEAANAYSTVIEQGRFKNSKKRPSLDNWARFYLWDLLIATGQEEEAERLLAGPRDSRSTPGQFLQNLHRGRRPLATAVPVQYENDLDYANALWAAQNNQPRKAVELLIGVAESYPQHDWPTALARDLVNSSHWQNLREEAQYGTSGD